MSDKIEKSEAEWRQQLTDEQYHVPGLRVCAQCSADGPGALGAVADDLNFHRAS